ncbi:MAG: hypothetical protein ACXWWC_04650, partial [Chitinophagaceae bacterium]
KFVAGFIGSPAMNFIKGTLQTIEEFFFIEASPGCRISLKDQIPVAVQNKIGEEIEIGIRPENIILSQQGSSRIQECMLEVMAFENMGNEQLIYLSMQTNTLIARRAAQEIIEIGNKFCIQFRQNEIIYLETSTGMIL